MSGKQQAMLALGVALLCMFFFSAGMHWGRSTLGPDGTARAIQQMDAPVVFVVGVSKEEIPEGHPFKWVRYENYGPMQALYCRDANAVEEARQELLRGLGTFVGRPEE